MLSYNHILLFFMVKFLSLFSFLKIDNTFFNRVYFVYLQHITISYHLSLSRMSCLNILDCNMGIVVNSQVMSSFVSSNVIFLSSLFFFFLHSTYHIAHKAAAKALSMPTLILKSSIKECNIDSSTTDTQQMVIVRTVAANLLHPGVLPASPMIPEHNSDLDLPIAQRKGTHIWM